MRYIPIRLVLLAVMTCAVIWCNPAQAMKWLRLSNADLLRRSDLVVEGVVETIVAAPDSAKRGSSDRPREPDADTVLDAAEVAHVKVTRILKGRARGSSVTIVYWSDFGDRENSHFSKYEAPRRLKPGQKMVFALRRIGRDTFQDYSAPAEARDAQWVFALPFIYDQQIQTAAFAAEAVKHRR
jgi:hypothetical protein